MYNSSVSAIVETTLNRLRDSGMPEVILDLAKPYIHEDARKNHQTYRYLDSCFVFDKTKEGFAFWRYVTDNYRMFCSYKNDQQHLIEYLLEQVRQGVEPDLNVFFKNKWANKEDGGISFQDSRLGTRFWIAVAHGNNPEIPEESGLSHKSEAVQAVLATESYNLNLFASVPEVEQPKLHLGDSGIRAHSCGELYPHVIVHKGELHDLKKQIIIAGREFPCPDMPYAKLKKWADEVADGINSGTIREQTTSELAKPILIEHFKRQGYDEAMVELIVMRHRQAYDYYALTSTLTVLNSFNWSGTPEGKKFWRAVSCTEITKLSAVGKHLPIDPRVMAALFALQYKQHEEFKPSALVNEFGELSIRTSYFCGVNLSELGLADLYFMVYYAPSESLMRVASDEFLTQAYKHLTK